MQNRYTPKNIKSFVQGYAKYYFDNIFGLANHVKQQVAYRLYTCKDTCLVEKGTCQICTCPTIQKAYATESCNKDKFPDMMDKTSWDLFMKENNITDRIVSMQEEIDEIIRERNNKQPQINK